MVRPPSLLPFAIAGFVAAVLLSDAFQLGGSPSDGPIRGVVTLLAPLMTLGVGVVATRPSFRPIHAALVAALGTLLSAAVAALIISNTSWTKRGLSLPLDGCLLAASCLGPCLGLLAALQRRTGRARPNSLIAEIDARSSWFALAALAALSSSVLQVAEFVPSYGPRLASLGTGALAVILVLWFCGRSLWTWTRAVAIKKAAREMLPSTHSTGTELRLDLGLGEDLVESAAGSSAYRSATVRKQIYGSPVVAARVAANHAMVALTVSGLVVVSTMAAAIDSKRQPQIAANHLQERR